VKPFDWNEIPREQLNPHLVRQAIHTGQMTVARLELKAGGAVPVHAHENEQISMVLSGRLKFIVAGEEVIVGPGQVLELKPNVPHGVEVLEDCAVIDLFTPPRADWISGDDAYLRK
jgi:quercetin dioxygenase-like cupin family protein